MKSVVHNSREPASSLGILGTVKVWKGREEERRSSILLALTSPSKTQNRASKDISRIFLGLL